MQIFYQFLTMLDALWELERRQNNSQNSENGDDSKHLRELQQLKGNWQQTFIFPNLGLLFQFK